VSDTRDRIIEEVIRRVLAHNAFANCIVYEGSGGVWGVWGRELPCLHIIEKESSEKIVKRGLYEIDLPIQLEYVYSIAPADRKRANKHGRLYLQYMKQALELDENLLEGINTDSLGDKLVIRYNRIATEIAEVVDDTLDVACVYNFVFAEKFLGYTSCI